jgi:hypothetical protein
MYAERVLAVFVIVFSESEDVFSLDKLFNDVLDYLEDKGVDLVVDL